MTPGRATLARVGPIAAGPTEAGSSVRAAYRLAGLCIRVTVAGPVLADTLLRALAHLRVDDDWSAPDLDISIWDESAVRAGVTRPGPNEEDVVRPLQVSPDGRRYVRSGPAGDLWLDLDARSLAGWFAAPTAVPAADRGKPFARLLAPWVRDHGRQIVHAAMVADGDAGVLIAGRGGVGKSTVALAASLAGFGYVGDDLVALEESRRAGFVGHSLYASCFVGRAHLERFPALPPTARDVLDPARDKVVLQLAHGLPGGTVRAAPVRAVLLPRVTDAAAGTLRSASAADALRALAPSSLFAHSGQGQAELDRLARLVGAVPRWWLDMGSRVDEIPSLVTRALAEADR